MSKVHPLLGRRILVVTAHPDDEAFSAAGLAWENARRGGETALICATLGEKGMAHLRRPMTSSQLKKRRFDELRSATRLARISPVHVLHLPDGGVSAQADLMWRRSWPIVQRWQPDAIVTFGPDGITGHRDHIAAGRIGRRLATRAGCQLFLFSLPPQLLQSAPKWFIGNRVNPHYHRIRPYARPTVKVTIDPKRKLKIMSQHRSQLEPSGPLGQLPLMAKRRLMAAEYFAAARP